MKFASTKISGVFLIDLEPRGDDRGFFARVYCEQEFGQHHLKTRFAQINNSVTANRGTLRGLHYQLPPAAEVKVVRCVRGGLYDLVLDLRPDSPTFGQSFGAELTAQNRRMMYVPEGCAHGFLTLQDDTEALYLVSEGYSPANERGVRYDDPAFKMAWPSLPLHMSDKDRTWPFYSPNNPEVNRLRGLLRQ